MIRDILKWVDTKFDKEINNTDGNQAKSILKCCGLGAIEGGVDCLAILGVASLIGIVSNSVLKKK